MKKTRKKKVKQNPIDPRMAYNDMIIDAVLKGSTIYIKDTGIEVGVESFNTNRLMFASANLKNVCIANVFFKTKPNTLALSKMNNYNFHNFNQQRVNDPKMIPNTNFMINGQIDLIDLSTIPFETIGAKILHKNS